ncbi:MAG: hypothetical protein K0Q72_2795, partial [Armatimonadetes bacterium]|nr:hypothetical protein [Armatimonadota bacterium]
MRLLTSLCLLLFTLGFPSPAPAATRFTPHPSGDRVRAMVCAGGRLWCATDGGVRVYSGTKHERWITTADGLPGAEITDLTVQGPSVLAVTGAGVYTLPMQAGEPVRLACAIRGAREGQTDAQGRLWLVGPFIGLVNAEECTRKQAEHARQPSPSPAGGPRGLLRLAVQGSLVWAAGPTGIGAWDGCRARWLPDGDDGMPPSAWISALFVHRDQVYAGTLEGLWRHEAGGWRPVGESAGLHDLRAGASFRGALWIAAGADLFSSDDGLTFRRQLPYSGTYCLATLPADPAGTPERLYLGTNGQGVARHAGDRWEALDSDGPPSGVITVTGNGKELWAGSFTGRTAVLLAGRWRDVPAPGPAGEGIAQLVSLNGIVWCRMSNGALWRRVAGTWQRVDRPWASTLCVSGGRLCVG